MSDYEDLVRRLTAINADSEYSDEAHWSGEAATAIETLRRERDALRALLREARAVIMPIATAAQNFDTFPVKDPEQWFAYSGQSSLKENGIGAITVGDLRRVSATLARIDAALKGGESHE